MFTRLAPLVLALGLLAPTLAAAADPEVGADAMTAGRQWLGGDPAGRQTLEAMAKAGRSDAQEVLGEVLAQGTSSVPRESAVACGYFRQASASRADALHSLAVCAENGVEGPADFALAAKLFGEAADRGFPKSMCALGNLYRLGKGVPKDAERGAALCRKAAELGDRDAQTDLGNFYVAGAGVPRDMVQARQWYEKAAAQGQPNAEYVLAQIYLNGDGVAKDQEKAAQLLTSAYRHGRRDAAGLLAPLQFARWMAGHPKGDTGLIDESIAWFEAALKVAPTDKARKDMQTGLDLARAARSAEVKG